MADRYLAPSWFTDNVFNRLVARLTKMGLSVWGSRVLLVRGRTSGEIRSNVVNVLTHDGERYLVAPRGTTQWVRNLRAAGKADLRRRRRARRGRRAADEAKPAVLLHSAPLEVEVGQFSTASVPTSRRRTAPHRIGYPVFRLQS
jgi:deazaflavin-dependent oxidoreductase (nitroreductase family)